MLTHAQQRQPVRRQFGRWASGRGAFNRELVCVRYSEITLNL